MTQAGPVAIGIDIGGTKISACAVYKGQLLSDAQLFETPDDIEELLNTVINIVCDLKSRFEPECVGIATAGTVNINNSKVTGSTGNLPKGYSGLDFKTIIEEEFGLKTMLENDANAAAYAELKTGNAQGDKSTIVITLGTGIGGGIIVDGKLLRGKAGVAAEIGHMPITWGKKRKCTCGAWDCWESYASGSGYALNAKEMAVKIPLEQREGILKDKEIETLTTYYIIDGFYKGDSFARKVHEQWESLVKMGIVSLVNIFDPDSVIISGGMAKFVNFEKLHREVEDTAVISKIKLLPAKHNNYAGIIGAAMLASEKFR
jgi:glucokinase